MKIAVIGLGKLGLPVACSFANTYGGHEVIGIDSSRALVDDINAGVCPHEEPGLEKILETARLIATTDYSVISSCDMSIIIVPTPSGIDDRFSNHIVEDVLVKIGAHVTAGHTVVVSSTVMPGSCDWFAEILSETSGMTVGFEVGLVYSPEFVALGSVLQNFHHPDLVLIGGTRTHADRYESLIQEVVGSTVPVFKMSYREAEIAKLSLNTYLNLKIGFANTLAYVCSRIPGTNALSVLEALGADSRIGRKFMSPGLPPGGTCLPRDLRAFRSFLDETDIQSDLPRALMSGNWDWEREIMRLIEKQLTLSGLQKPRLGVLGLSFKPGTPVMEESFGVKVVERFGGMGVSVKTYDRLARLGFRNNVAAADTAEKCVNDSDVIVICTAEKEFFSVDLRGKSTVDIWGIRESAPNVHVPWKTLIT